MQKSDCIHISKRTGVRLMSEQSEKNKRKFDEDKLPMKKFLHTYKIEVPIELEDDDYLKVDLTSIVWICDLDIDISTAQKRGKNNLKRLGQTFKSSFINGVGKRLLELSDKQLKKMKMNKEILSIEEDKNGKIEEMVYKS
jgi:hypothetical protein